MSSNNDSNNQASPASPTASAAPSTHLESDHVAHGPLTQPLIDERKALEELEGPTTVPTLQFEDSRTVRGLAENRVREGEPSLSPPSTSLLMAREEQSLVFNGTGSEYFRIWVVNLALTILTLGVYSAWAKVRRMQYFYRATNLEGVCFDYVAKPTNILGGRVIALAMFGLYYVAHNFMPELGALVIVLVIAVMPFLLLQSARFKARNTLHRGLSFHFDGTVSQAYQTYLPPLIVAFGPSAMAGLVLSTRGGIIIFVLLLLGGLAWPFFHAVFRRFMQRNLRYGDAAFGFDARNRDFFSVWVKGMGLSLLLSLVFMLLIFVFGSLIGWMVGASKSASMAGVVGGIAGVLAFYVAYSCIGSYYTARFQKLVWEHTALGEISFKCNLSAWKLLKRQFINTLLIIGTLGLYRPFAAVNVAKMRLQSMTVVGTERLEEFYAAPDKSSGGAIGEGSAEMFDMDVSF
jgi:uncharacterized membrane protein YjgN (DUF898 family)